MTFSAGTLLGTYEILSPLGAGGMGEVWRATDTRLDREVALKVLPHEFSQDPDRLARFEREAKVLASLNHTNIATLFGLESATPVNSDAAGPEDPQHPNSREKITYLVMELVEGEDLSERITRGPIPVDEAIPIALQIAEEFSSVSPDQRFVAYQANDSGSFEVYIEPLSGDAGRVQVSRSGGSHPRWGRTGELFFWHGNELNAVSVATSPELAIGEPAPLFEFERHAPETHGYAVSPDGRSFFMTRIPEGSRPREIRVVLNWFTELERLTGGAP